jgi:hypothetical protein
MLHLIENNVAASEAGISKIAARKWGSWKFAVDESTAWEDAALNICVAEETGNEDTVEKTPAFELRILKANIGKCAMLIYWLIERYSVKSLAGVDGIGAAIYGPNSTFGTTNEINRRKRISSSPGNNRFTSR